MSGGKLTALKLKALTSPGRYGDGNGLWLQVRDAAHRSWLFRYTVGGRARQMGLGRFPEVSLAEARDAAGECRAVARTGLDPIEERRKVRSANRQVGSNVTFKQVVDRYISVHETSWCNAKHRYQWRQTLGLACGEIGKTAVAEISTGDVMRVLEPIWREKPETASRLRGRIESVLDYAAAHGWRGGENPARWRGHLAKLLPAPSKIAQVEHHPALPWQQIGKFMTELRDQEGVAARALEFTILTAARTGEAIGGRILELNTQAAVWTVPASRMKSKRIHRVPLSQPAMMVLDKVAPLGIGGPETWLFPGEKGRRRKRPAPSPNAFAYTLDDSRAMGGPGKTKTYKLAKEGRLKLLHVDGRTLVDGDSCELCCGPSRNRPGAEHRSGVSCSANCKVATACAARNIESVQKCLAPRRLGRRRPMRASPPGPATPPF